MTNKKILFFILVLLFNSKIHPQSKIYISTNDAIEDLKYLIKTIEEVHYNPFFSIEKPKFKEIENKIINSFKTDSITLKKFIASGMKLTALLSGGHTQFDWQNQNIMQELSTYNFLPFTGKFSRDKKYFIVTNSLDDKIPINTKITKVNNLKILELYNLCADFIGGIQEYKKISLEKIFPLYLFFLNNFSPPYKIEVSNSLEKIETNGVLISDLLQLINNNSSQREDYTFKIIENNIGLISYNSCQDYQAFEKFLERTFSDIHRYKIDKLIIDLRENGGGDSSLNDLLLSYLTTKPYRQLSGRFWKVSNQAKSSYKKNNYTAIFGSKFMDKYNSAIHGSIIKNFNDELTYPVKANLFFKGKSCFLIGPKTFSSANFLADAIKTYKLSTLIGLPTGENTNDFGEQIELQLPISKNYFFVSTTYDIGADGDRSSINPVTPHIQIEEDALNYAIKWMLDKQ